MPNCQIFWTVGCYSILIPQHLLNLLFHTKDLHCIIIEYTENRVLVCEWNEKGSQNRLNRNGGGGGHVGTWDQPSQMDCGVNHEVFPIVREQIIRIIRWALFQICFCSIEVLIKNTELIMKLIIQTAEALSFDVFSILTKKRTNQVYFT